MALLAFFVPPGDLGTPLGALAYSASHALNLLFLYVVAVFILKEGRGPRLALERKKP